MATPGVANTETRVPDEEVTPEVQALWSLRNALRLARADPLCKFEQARAAALEHAVVFAENAASISRKAVRLRDAELAKRIGAHVP